MESKAKNYFKDAAHEGPNKGADHVCHAVPNMSKPIEILARPQKEDYTPGPYLWLENGNDTVKGLRGPARGRLLGARMKESRSLVKPDDDNKHSALIGHLVLKF